MFFSFLLFRIFTLLFSEHAFENWWVHPSMITHAIASLSLLSMWAFCFWGTHTLFYVRIVETAGITATVIATFAMGTYIPLNARPEYNVILALSYDLALRSVYVPSSALRTFILCTISGIPILVSTYLMYLKIDIHVWSHLIPFFGTITELEISLTIPEIVTGTPLYMDPESIQDPASVDGRADIDAIGAVGYSLLTGTDVFSDNSIVEVCGHHRHSSPEPPSQRLNGKVPQDLEKLLLSCLAKDPNMRPQSASSLRQQLLDCRITDAWNQEKARAWWHQHEATLQSYRSKKRDEMLSGTVLEIDFSARKERQLD